MGSIRHLDWPVIVIIAAGVALRWALFAAGRSPLDGDETIMGVMAYHMSRLERFPIYFYRQHYMGTIEVPLCALFDLFGGEAWRFSAWPIRLTQTVYFVLYAGVHYALCRRFFGRRAALWALWFTTISQYYWMDYSLRLRHATLMMLIGEWMAIIAWDEIERRRQGGEARHGPVILLGVLAGVGWWHYQLISAHFAALAALALAFAPSRLAWITRVADGKRRIDIGAAARAAFSLGAAGLLAGLSLGWGSRRLWKLYPDFYYSEIVYPLLAIICGAGWLAWRAYSREASGGSPEADASASARLAPALLALGFALGYFPAWHYLANMKEEFWVSPTQLSAFQIFDRLKALLLLEVSAMLEISRPERPNSNVYLMGPLSYLYLAIYFGAAYLMARKLAPWVGRRERAGAFYFLALAAFLVFLHVLFPRPTAIDSPRFLVPLFAASSVGLGLLANAACAGYGRLSERFGPLAERALAGVIATACFALWAPVWRSHERHEMVWPSGHRKAVVALGEALEARGVQRLALAHGTDWVLLGYELQFVCRLKIRVNRRSMGDRLEGILDERRYGGDLHYLLMKDDPRGRVPELREVFQLGDYAIYHVSPGVVLDDWNKLVRRPPPAL